MKLRLDQDPIADLCLKLVIFLLILFVFCWGMSHPEVFVNPIPNP